MRWLLPLFCLLLGARPARAEGDEAVALAGVLQQAHEHLDDSWVRRMMAPAEQRRFDEDGGVGQFRRLRQALGVAHLVICSEGIAEPGVRMPSAAGDLLPPRPFRCVFECQRGRYLALLTLGPSDVLVRPAPKAGRIERLYLSAEVLDRSPWPAVPAWACLAALLSAALALGAWGVLRLLGRAPFGRPPEEERPPWLLRAQHELVLMLRLLSVLLLLCVGLPLVLRLGPLPRWGSLAMGLALLGVAALAAGILLTALGGYFHPRGGRSLTLALAFSIVPGAAVLGLALRTSLADLHALLDEPDIRQLGRYRLPLREGPVYVRHGGALLDAVYLHGDGRSCHGSAPERCASFGRDVLAPAEGVVEAVEDRCDDMPVGERDRERPAGNYVLLRHLRERTLLAHLLRGSVRVRAGDRVQPGQLLGRIGNSGDSDEPHLSMERLAAPQPLPGRRPPPFCGAAADPERSTEIPIYLDGYQRLGVLGRRRIDRGAPGCGEWISP